MASVCNDPGGRKRITWTQLDGRPAAIYLGRASRRSAESVARHIERLIEARMTVTAPDPEVMRWLTALPNSMHAKLSARGLVEPRVATEVITLQRLCDAYAAVYPGKSASLVAVKRGIRHLVAFFGADRNASTVTEADAESWRAALVARGYSGPTIARSVKYARSFWQWGMKRLGLPSNPFCELKTGSQRNAARQRFIDRATIAKVIDAAPSASWRLLIALSRFGGLRVPSEALRLRWSDVDWAGSRLLIRSPKTEHHEAGGDRVIPLFPELKTHLLEAFALAEEGCDEVFSFPPDYNPHTQLERIICRAGVVQWPRLWHNLRASRQTELTARFPLHVVCSWIGNSAAVARDHYLQVVNADFQRAIYEPEQAPDSDSAPDSAPAARNAARSARASDAQGKTRGSKSPGNDASSRALSAREHRGASDLVGVGGPEHPSKSRGKSRVRGRGSAPGSAPSVDHMLAELTAAWAALTPTAKLMVLKAASQARHTSTIP